METHLELLVHARSARRPGRQQVRHVRVQEVRGHQGVAAHDGLHQGVVNEHVLLLQTQCESVRPPADHLMLRLKRNFRDLSFWKLFPNRHQSEHCRNLIESKQIISRR